MSWLDDLNRNRTYCYKNTSDAEDMIYANQDTLKEMSGNPEFDPTPGTSFEYEGAMFEYAGMESVQLGLTTKIVFEKNGRKAMRTKFGDGKQVIRSLAKENHLNGKGSDSVLTKACAEASNKAKEKITYNRMQGMKHELKKQAHMMKESKRR